MGVGHRPRFTFWLTFFQSYMLPLFFNGLLSYLVGMKRRTSRCFTCKRDNSYSLRYLKSQSIMQLGVFLVGHTYYFRANICEQNTNRKDKWFLILKIW